MKRNILFSLIGLMAGSLAAADSKDTVQAAAAKLAESANYSWKTTTEGAGGGRFRAGPTEGKTQKDGLTALSITRGDNTREAVLMGEKGAVKTEEGWQSLSEAAEGEGQRGGFLARTLRNFKAPAAEARELSSKATALEKSGDAYAGELTAEGVREMLRFGRRDGGGPEVSNAKGSVKFWIKDGVLSKYEYNVQATVNFNGTDREINRTTTVEIKDVGTTKVEIPAEAKAKLS